MRKIRRLLLALVPGVFLVGALQFGPALAPPDSPLAPPPAAAINFKICNDPRSDETIQAYVSSYNYAPFLRPGDCSNTMVAEGTRVDVDVVCCGDLGVDIDSYKIYSSGWGKCHVGETNDSDPPNDPNGIVYWNSVGSSCQ